MTDEELIAYFKDKALPEALRLDRATMQYEVRDAVERNSANILANPLDHVPGAG